MIKDEENIYNLEDTEHDDDSGLNYAYISNEEADVETEKKETSLKKISVFRLMLMILYSPVEGWKSVRRSKVKVENAQSDCFYPLLALLAASCFINLIYDPYVTLSGIIVNAIVKFVSYFFGYFAILLVLRLTLPKYALPIFEGNYGRVYIILSLSTLCMFNIIGELLPMIWVVVFFFPLWTIYSMLQGMRFFKLSEKGIIRFTFIVCVSVIGVPLVLEKLLFLILP